MKRVTLVGIKRRGLSNWKAREWWLGRKVSIWSAEHAAWWRPEAKGYTSFQSESWVVDFATAYQHTAHCGHEKRISYYAVSSKDQA